MVRFFGVLLGFFLLYIDQYWKFLINICILAAGTSSLWHSGSAKKGCFVSWCCITSSTFLRYSQIFHSTVHIKIRLRPSSLSLRVCMFKCFFLTVHCRAEIIRPFLWSFSFCTLCLLDLWDQKWITEVLTLLEPESKVTAAWILWQLKLQIRKEKAAN